jgi:hypothetical protein
MQLAKENPRGSISVTMLRLLGHISAIYSASGIIGVTMFQNRKKRTPCRHTQWLSPARMIYVVMTTMAAGMLTLLEI